jgi:hypothetical protein
MLRLASDADVNGAIIRGLRLRVPSIDLIRSQDYLNDGVLDPEVLSWAAAQQRVLITNDRNTMTKYALRRANTAQAATGIIATTNNQSIGTAIDDIILIAECMSETEIRNRVVIFLPFRG